MNITTIVTGKGHLLRALGFQRKTLSAAAIMESACGDRGEIRDGEMRIYYLGLVLGDDQALAGSIKCPRCRELCGLS